MKPVGVAFCLWRFSSTDSQQVVSHSVYHADSCELSHLLTSPSTYPQVSKSSALHIFVNYIKEKDSVFL